MLRRQLLARAVLISIVCPLMAISQESQSGKQLSLPDASEYTTYRLPIPSNFQSLEQWAQENYTSYIVPGTLKAAVVGGQAAVEFWTLQGGIYDHQRLSTDGQVLILESTINL